jgi:hypothetical protein
MKFCFLLGKTVAEAVIMLKETFKDKTMRKTQVYEWFNCFKRAEMFVEDQPHCGHGTMSRTDKNVGKVCQAVRADRHRSTEFLT